MLKDHHCPFCGEFVMDSSAAICPKCEGVLDEQLVANFRDLLKDDIAKYKIYLSLRSYDVNELTPKEVIDAHSNLHFLLSDMRTSSDFNPDGKHRY